MPEVKMEPSSIDSEKEIIEFLTGFCNFDAGLYTLTSIARPRENEWMDANDRISHSETLISKEQIKQKTRKLQAISDSYTDETGRNPTYRLYISSNPADIENSLYEMQLKLIQLKKKIEDGEKSQRKNAANLHREWISATSQEGALAQRRHLIDIDKKEEDMIGEAHELLISQADIHYCIETPNGYHLLTDGTNPKAFEGHEYIEHKGKFNNLFISFL